MVFFPRFLTLSILLGVSGSVHGWSKHHKGGGMGPGCDGDPHFSGADSSHFDFAGVPNTTYCLLTDSHVAINAYLGGYYGSYEGRTKSITWMREVGILWGHHSIVMKARQGPNSNYENGYMESITVDGQPVTLQSAGDKVTFENGLASIQWISAKEASGEEFIDVYAVEINGVMSAILELRPEVANFRTETDGTIHFDIYLPATYLSDNVHGVLGQTYRSDHANRLAGLKLTYSNLLGAYVVPGDNGDGYLDGTVDDYKTSAITATDCAFNRFTRMSTLDSEAAQAMELSGSVPSVLGVSAASSTMDPSTGTFRRLRRMRLMKKLKLR